LLKQKTGPKEFAIDKLAQYAYLVALV